MVPIIRPSPAATIPLRAILPARIPTIDNPKTDTMSNSGDLNKRTTGLATKIKTVRKAAPTKPPNKDEEKAADRALAA